ncbi:MAG: hypothetical protein HKL80_10450 [Acidimicrobiales bacterium]|nr:hypothetical protein [Acidimicrobiales bacterium]
MQEDKPLIITAEELFLFSLSRDLPYIPGVPAAMNSKADSAGLEPTLDLAARVLASRGIPPALGEGQESNSPNEVLLKLLCSPELRVVVSIFDAKDSIVWDMVKSNGKALLHAWGRANEHLISEFEITEFYDRLCSLSGISIMDDSPDHACDAIEIKEVSKLSDLDSETVIGKIKQWNPNSKCAEVDSTSLAASLKGESPTVLITFNGSDSDVSRVALSSWMPSTSSSAWLVQSTGDQNSDPENVKLSHVDKSDLELALKSALERVS